MDIVISVPIIIAIVQVIKQTRYIEDRFIPIVSLFCGILFYAIFSGIDTTSIYEGLIAGLTASGLYSGVKTTIKK